jgi:hypothetical protein
MVQSCPDASPMKWHQAYNLVSRDVRAVSFSPGLQALSRGVRWLFNSYYNSLGEEAPEKQLRSSFSRPSLDEVPAFRAHVDEAMEKFFAGHIHDDAHTDDLGLTEASVAVDKRGYIVLDDQLRTCVPGIWALGDCTGRGAVTRTAFNDAEIVGTNLLDNDPRKVSDRITAYALYTDPSLGRGRSRQKRPPRADWPAAYDEGPSCR